MKEIKKPVSRKSFIKGAGTTLAGIALLGSTGALVSGCADGTQNPSQNSPENESKSAEIKNMDLAELLVSGKFEFVDMSQPLNEDTLVIELPEPFANTPDFKSYEISKYDEKGPAWYWNYFTMGEHVGTHFDAPIHWITGKDLASVDKIPAADFVGEAIVIDKKADADENPDTLLTVEDILAFEKKYGKIPPRSWVIMKTGWGKYAQDAEKFFNMGDDGMPHTPGIEKEAVELLAKERDILGYGTETVGTDAGIAGTFDPAFPAHHILQGNGKFGLASLANVDQLPPRGAVLIAAPLKITDGSGSPIRPIAIVPKG